MLRLFRNLLTEVFGQFLSVIDHGHSPTAQHIAGPHHHGVGDALGHFQRLFQIHGRAVGRLQQAQLLNQGLKALTILGAVDGVGRGSQNGHARAHQRHSQIQRSLPAELDDDALGLFLLHNVHDVLKGQRLKVEPVRGVIVRGHGFRVGIDHDGHDSGVAQGKGGVAAAVVKLDALTDAVGPAAKNEHLAAVLDRQFIAAFICGVKIGGIGLKLGRAGIHQIVGGHNAHFLAQTADVALRPLPHFSKLPVGEAVLLGFAQHNGQSGVGRGHVVGHAEIADAGFHVHDVPDLTDEPGVNGRGGENVLFADAGHQSLAQGEDTA